jgi:predicted ester cyclase
MTALVNENEPIIRRIYEEMPVKGDLAVVDGIYDSRFVNYSIDPPLGLAAMRDRYTAIRSAFPDWQETIESIGSKGNKIVVRSVVRGTHTGNWNGIAPTGRHVEAMRITILRAAGGKIVERWGSQDELGLMQQLNAIPLHLSRA